MRADRLLSLLFLLQTKHCTSARALAEQLDVSERTIYRDIDALSMIGFPVYAVHGAQGGFALLPTFRLDLSKFTRQELITLLIDRSSQPLTALGIKAAPQMRAKLLQRLPEAYRLEAEKYRQHLFIDTDSWFNRSESLHFLPLIEKAMMNQHCLHICYQKANSEVVCRTIAPCGLVAKMNTWYLIATHDNKYRVYRVSRMTHLDVTDEKFTFPEAFTIDRFWSSWCTAFEQSRSSYSVLLRTTQNICNEIIERGYKVSDNKEGKEPFVEINVDFETANQAVKELLSLGSEARVIRPAELRYRVIARARALLKSYKS
ncbi:MAG: WYL domain-containing protein [Sporolactobacillus sp.]